MVDIADAAQINEQKERDAALARFHHTKQYGKSCEFCIKCGDPISINRKIAMPNATKCMQCQVEFEGNI
ncbi:MAG: TraR/DksA C4-type zinc finger protein [Rhizobiales bacterium]|nr:TraR/DksA C4-type zinc finger protein [Hyphomicrobiales bacterium]